MNKFHCVETVLKNIHACSTIFAFWKNKKNLCALFLVINLVA
jgi:hypothetical protein